VFHFCRKADSEEQYGLEQSTQARRRGGLPLSRSQAHLGELALQSGTALQELMELGGWKSYEMVLRYAHLAPEKLSSVASRIEWKSSSGDFRRQ
jgi:hypothetical protein